MPCITEGWRETPAEQREREKREWYEIFGAMKASAVLCGVFTSLGSNLPAFLDTIDWNEVGVKRTLVERWWKEHHARDRRRLAEERREKRETAKRSKALAKLTAAERRLLEIEE